MSFGALERLARLYRVMPAYRDGFDRLRTPPPETLTAVLRQLGAPIASAADADDALRTSLVERCRAFAPPAAALWQGEAPRISLRGVSSDFVGVLRCSIQLEDGGLRSWEQDAGELPLKRRIELGRERYEARVLQLPCDLPTGYHRLDLELGPRRREVRLICAPAGCYRPESDERLWGVFLPLYALHGESSWGAGDLSDLGALFDWVRERGGSMVGTLPLLAAFLDEEPFDHSPYQPASRLFWNEFFIDPRRTPEWQRSAAARERVQANDDLILDLRGRTLVDYPRQEALKRNVLSRLALQADSDPARRGELDCFVAERPLLQSYADFRAVTERRGEGWQRWPERLREGRLEPGDFDLERSRYHLYAQWIAHQQLADLARRAADPGLYLDLPLGVHPAGFDVWRQPDSFALGVGGGAPPDSFFTMGQNWGFAPLHPEATRRDGYQLFTACLRHHLEHAGVLRIDHFMGLHRLYWIPHGAQASEGTYVQYHADELYAVVCLESMRHRARVIGEDLGTVPAFVRARMARRRVDRMFVAQFEFQDAADPFPSPATNFLACVNTHDTPTFAAFWQGLDIADQLAMGLIDESQADQARAGRQRLRQALSAAFSVESAQQALEGCLDRLAASDARYVMINLEDLWAETSPQNTPGSGPERPNWRRRSKLSLEQIREDPSVARALEIVRRKRASP